MAYCWLSSTVNWYIGIWRRKGYGLHYLLTCSFDFAILLDQMRIVQKQRNQVQGTGVAFVGDIADASDKIFVNSSVNCVLFWYTADINKFIGH
ncbi:hypothetical protein BpHYR1_043514 [Brachionus plicatilis]|uniref:Uncharacterized protein n=1 Tax=Brachionus plicatilis TaxID=10195 RepID=A0A3M7RK54_BRAPC|nr:hypothetical protein BpHYR1_043514 [Brachionus plicatilis]